MALDRALDTDRPEIQEKTRNCAAPALLWFAGRLDNIAEISQALSLSAEAPFSLLLSSAYERWGRECGKHLLGGFAFVIWDPERRLFFGCRDALGEQPFFYHFCDRTGRLACADNVEQLLNSTGLEEDLDEGYVAAALTEAYFQDRRTWLRQVRKMPPGHFFEIRDRQCRIQPYWRPQDVPSTRLGSEEEYAERMRELIRTAVNRRIPRDGKFGIHVSGGLDSAAIAGICGDRKPAAFAWQPAPPRPGDQTEFELIDAVATRHRLRVEWCPPSVDDVLEVYERDPARVPMAGRSPNEWPVQKAARELGVKHMISGFGGDEAASYSGNGMYEALFLGGRWLKLVQLARRHKSRPFRFILSLARSSLEAALVPDAAYKWLTPAETDEEKMPYLNEDFRRSVTPAPDQPSVRRTSIRRAKEQLLNGGHTRNIVEAWNGSGALVGVTYSFPLMDRELIEFALGLPPEQVFDGKWDRLAFRRAIDPLTPERVCWERRKVADPQRADSAHQACFEAFAKIRERVLDRAAPPARAKYLDMPRLLRDLEPDRLAKRQRIGRLELALRFLDF